MHFSCGITVITTVCVVFSYSLAPLSATNRTVTIQCHDVNSTVVVRCSLDRDNASRHVCWDFKGNGSTDRRSVFRGNRINGTMPDFADRFEITMDASSNESTLTIRDLRSSDAGIYMCFYCGASVDLLVITIEVSNRAPRSSYSTDSTSLLTAFSADDTQNKSHTTIAPFWFIFITTFLTVVLLIAMTIVAGKVIHNNGCQRNYAHRTPDVVDLVAAANNYDAGLSGIYAEVGPEHNNEQQTIIDNMPTIENTESGSLGNLEHAPITTFGLMTELELGGQQYAELAETKKSARCKRQSNRRSAVDSITYADIDHTIDAHSGTKHTVQRHRVP